MANLRSSVPVEDVLRLRMLLGDDVAAVAWTTAEPDACFSAAIMSPCTANSESIPEVSKPVCANRLRKSVHA